MKLFQNTFNKAVAALLLTASSAFAGSITLFDDTFQLSLNGTAVQTGVYEVKWGTYSGGVFTPYLGNAASSDNAGYADLASPELSVSFTASGNTVAAVGAQASLAILFAADDSTYSAATPQVILTDSSWIIPTFTLTGPDLSFDFTSTTQVQGFAGGTNATYSFGAGNQVINLVTVPEPSTYAALVGMMVLGAVATRRRRSA